MIAVPPFRAEFGILLRFHAAAVRALPRPLVVAHEPGLEALYPDCTRWIVASRNDDERRWTYKHDAEYTKQWVDKMKEKGYEVVMPDKTNRFPIQPWALEPFKRMRPRGTRVGIVVCPRKRRYGAEKNWDAWPQLVKTLRQNGNRVFVAGLKDTSYEFEADEYAWDYERPLDATIEAMLGAQVVVATASGLSLLALLCGAPLVLVASTDGKVAPGPARDLTGKVHHDTYWKIPLSDYYEPLNHSHVPIDVVNGGWQSPNIVFTETMKRIP